MGESDRSYLFDNLKVFLSFFVVFGHCLEEISTTGTYGTIRACIYAFHMPAFVFISGYFTKDDEKISVKALKNCLIPFLIFNSLYVLLTQKEFILNLFYPQYLFWYFLSLFFWRSFIRCFSYIRGIFVISIFIALYIGLVKDADRFLAISRTIAFFPYFILGFKFRDDHIKKIRKIPKKIVVVGVFQLLIVVFILHTLEIIPVKSYENIQSYSSTGLEAMEGIVIRALSFVIGFLVIGCLLNLLLNKPVRYTKYGTRIVAIYVFSAFFLKGIYVILKKIGTIEYLIDNVFMGVGVSFIISIMTILFCGSSVAYNCYLRIVNFISQLLIKEREKKNAREVKS